VKESAQRFRRQIGLMAATRIMAANPKSAAPRTTNLTKVCFLFGGAGLTLAIILGKWWLALLAMPCFVLGVESYRRSRRAG
jgi:hypothetical protein